MLKKLLTLGAVALMCSAGANAKVVIDHVIDYSTMTSFPWYVMGYTPSFEDGAMVSTNLRGSYADDGTFTPNKDEDGDGQPDPSWYQYFAGDGLSNLEAGTSYTITFTIKASEECSINCNLQWGWGDGERVSASVPFPAGEYAEVDVDFPDYGGNGGAIIAQPGTCTATLYWKKAVIWHNEKETVDLTEWIEHLVNGDAEGEYGEVPCAYSKWYQGRDAGDGHEIANPVPSPIETVDGSKVFVCHAKKVDPNEFPSVFLNDDGSVKGDPQWQNQFWIQSPQAWNEGDMFRVSFRYKASKAVAADTQAHGENPGGYLYWEMIGGINFTTEWQQFSKTVTVNGSQKGMWSIAFNLKEYDSDVDYYFDDLKWETMKLDEGWFVAGDFNDYDYAHAIEMVYNEADEANVATVGTSEVPAEVIQISTVRGNDTAFKQNTVKNKADFEEDYKTEDGDWKSYESKAGQKITLPLAGIWKVMIAEETTEIGIALVEGAGISDVVFDAFGTFEYYTLQGVKVENPVRGNIYIIKQGNKVIKALYR